MTLLAIIIWISSVGVFVWLYRGLSPLVEPRIVTRWEDRSLGLLVLRVEVKNHAKFRVVKEWVLFQVLEYDILLSGRLSDWVPFSKDDVLPTEQPRRWQEPTEIMKSTKWLEPGEKVIVEWLYKCPKGTVVHFGVQFKETFKKFWRRIPGDTPTSGRWTSTGFAYFPTDHESLAKDSTQTA